MGNLGTIGKAVQVVSSATQAGEAATGKDLASGETLSTSDRVARGVTGGVGLHAGRGFTKEVGEAGLDGVRRAGAVVKQEVETTLDAVRHTPTGLRPAVAGADVSAATRSVDDAARATMQQMRRMDKGEVVKPAALPHASTNERIGHGDWYARKDIRQGINEAKPASYDKHIKAKTAEQAQEFSMKEAQYLPSVKANVLEREAMWGALKSGRVVHDESVIYFFHRFDHPIGYDKGKATHWIRAELTSGSVHHGHPMSVERVRKYFPDVKE